MAAKAYVMIEIKDADSWRNDTVVSQIMLSKETRFVLEERFDGVYQYTLARELDPDELPIETEAIESL